MILNAKRYTLPALILGLIVFLPQTALAVETEFGEKANNIEEYIGQILDWVVPIVAGLALLMLIYAGYKYITSQGNPEAINQAKDIIIGVLVGIALLFLMELILNQLNISTGQTPSSGQDEDNVLRGVVE